MRKTALFIILFVFISLFQTGCEPDNGRVGPTKYASKLGAGHDQGLWTPAGDPNYLFVDFWLAYLDDFNYVIDQEGLRVQCVSYTHSYWYSDGHSSAYYDTDATGIFGSHVTGEGGYATFTAFREWYPVNPHPHGTARSFKVPNKSGSQFEAGFHLSSDGSLKPYVNPWEYKQMVADTHVNGTEIAFEPGGSPVASTSGLSDKELVAVGLPSSYTGSGVSSSCALLQQRGKIGEGYVKSMESGFVPFNQIDPNNIFRYSSPMAYSYTVQMAEPENLDGAEFQFKVTTDSNPNGIVVYGRAIASNTDNTVHVVRTDYFLPVDPATFSVLDGEELSVYDRWTPIDANDTNNFMVYEDRVVSKLKTSDPNFMVDDGFIIEERVLPLQCIEVAEVGDYMEIEFIPDSSTVLNAAVYWLTDNKTYDSNDDGVINLMDLIF